MAAPPGRRPSCSTEAPAFDFDHELLRDILLRDDKLINPLNSPYTSLISNEPAPPLFNSNCNASSSLAAASASASSASNSMEQAFMNASLHQPSPSLSFTYCPPPSSKVFEFECLPAYGGEDGTFWRDSVLLTDINEIRDFDCLNLPDLSTFDVSIIEECINTMDSTLAPHELAAMENQAILSPDSYNTCHNSGSSMIDLPTASVVGSPISYMSCSSASVVAHGEIKDVISWADSFSSTSNIGSPMEIASLPATASQLPYSHTSVPPSPTQSNANMESSSEVAIRVKTPMVNLHDGYVWRKYGEKNIKNQKFRRGYFRCAQYGCNVRKRTERCSRRQEYMVFTYMGRHNHHP